MLNKCVLMGRFVRDPELKTTGSGLPVTSFTLAVERDFKNQDGQRETDFIDVTAWRNTATFVSQYFSKGRMAVVEGRLQIRQWRDKEGNNRRNAEIVADNVYFAGPRSDGQQSTRTEQTPAQYEPQEQMQIDDVDGEDDIPF